MGSRGGSSAEPAWRPASGTSRPAAGRPSGCRPWWRWRSGRRRSGRRSGPAPAARRRTRCRAAGRGPGSAPTGPRRCRATGPARSPRSCPGRCQPRWRSPPRRRDPAGSRTRVTAVCSQSSPEPMARTRALRHHLRRREDVVGRAGHHGEQLPGHEEGGKGEERGGEAPHRSSHGVSSGGWTSASAARVAASIVAAARVAGEARGPRSRQVDRDDLGHAARPWGHDHDPIRHPRRPRRPSA